MKFPDNMADPMTQDNDRKASHVLATALSLLIGTGGIMVTGLQPLLLGSLLTQGIITPGELGVAGSVEIFALAVGIVVGSRLLTNSGSRWYIVLAALAMAVCNLVTGEAGAGWQVIVLRLLSGLFEGVLIAVVMLAIAHAPRPERLGGFFLSVSGPPSLVLAYMLPTMLNPWLGWNAGFIVLAGIGIICALAGAAYNGKFAPDRFSGYAKFVWNRPIVLALSAALLANAAFGACFTYVEPLARLRGITDVRVGEIMSLAIGCMIAGSLAVASSGRYFKALPFLKGAAILQIGAILLLLLASTDFQFAIGLGALCFFWQASAPCAIALITALDETRATAQLSFPLQLVGLSSGPLVAATAASSSLSNPYFIGLGLLAAASLFLSMVGRSLRGELEVRP